MVRGLTTELPRLGCSQGLEKYMPKRVKIGVVGIDAGLCWIGDPSYILHTGRLPKDIGKDWDDFCDRLGKAPTKAQFKDDDGKAGLGVCVSTGYGDGLYPVFVEYDADIGKIARVTVEFIPQGE